MISWANPDEELKDKGFEDYMLEGPVSALKEIERATGQKAVNAIGYCMGGTLLACTTAYLTAKGEGDRIHSGTYMASLIDFSEPGDIGVVLNIFRPDDRRFVLTGLGRSVDALAIPEVHIFGADASNVDRLHGQLQQADPRFGVGNMEVDLVPLGLAAHAEAFDFGDTRQECGGRVPADDLFLGLLVDQPREDVGSNKEVGGYHVKDLEGHQRDHDPNGPLPKRGEPWRSAVGGIGSHGLSPVVEWNPV
jgi:hypothetical protein